MGKPTKSFDDNSGDDKADPVSSAVILVLELGLVGWHFYEKLVLQPAHEAEREAMAKWGHVIGWAKAKQPTIIRMVVENDSVTLHNATPERLHKLTAEAIRALKQKQS